MVGMEPSPDVTYADKYDEDGLLATAFGLVVPQYQSRPRAVGIADSNCGLPTTALIGKVPSRRVSAPR